MISEDLVALAAVIEGFGSVGILLFTVYQVWHMRKELRQANVQTCFSIELEVYEARRRFEDASVEVLKRRSETKSLPETERESEKTTEETLLLTRRFDAAKEAYFSELDRLCSYILRKRLEEKDFKEDWAPLIGELVDGNKEDFRVKYINILRLNKKWGDGY